MHRPALAAAFLALSTPALAADLDYPPPVVERERIIERRTYVPAPVIRERVYVEPRVYGYDEPRVYWDGPRYRAYGWRQWDRRPYATAGWGWDRGHRGRHWRHRR